MKENIAEKLFGGIFTFIGAVFLIIGIFVLKNDTDFKKKAEITEGTVTNIESYRDSDGDISHKVDVEFYVGDERIAGPINSYSSSMYIGGPITIYYDPYNPQDFRSDVDVFVGYIFSFIGGVFFIIGCSFTIYIIKTKNKIKKLIEIGEKIYAPFDRVEVNEHYEVNGKNPYIIVCKSTSSEIDEYKSRKIWIDPTNIIKERNVTMFPIYVDPENSKNYYLSTEEIDEYLKK